MLRHDRDTTPAGSEPAPAGGYDYLPLPHLACIPACLKEQGLRRYHVTYQDAVWQMRACAPGVSMLCCL